MYVEEKNFCGEEEEELDLGIPLFLFSSITIFRRVFRKQRKGLRTCCFALTSVFGRQREGCRVSCFGLKLGDYRRCNSTAEIKKKKKKKIDLSGGGGGGVACMYIYMCLYILFLLYRSGPQICKTMINRL